MARYWCERCGEESNTLSEPHLCKDVKRRHERRQKQALAVYDILAAGRGTGTFADMAEAIVEKLAGMGVADD